MLDLGHRHRLLGDRDRLAEQALALAEHDLPVVRPESSVGAPPLPLERHHDPHRQVPPRRLGRRPLHGSQCAPRPVDAEDHRPAAGLCLHRSSPRVPRIWGAATASARGSGSRPRVLGSWSANAPCIRWPVRSRAIRTGAPVSGDADDHRASAVPEHAHLGLRRARCARSRRPDRSRCAGPRPPPRPDGGCHGAGSDDGPSTVRMPASP